MTISKAKTIMTLKEANGKCVDIGGAAGMVLGAPPPEPAMPGTWAVQVGPTQVRPAKDLAAQAAKRAARWSITYESRIVKTAKTVAARPCRTEEREGARPPPPVHAAAPLH
jgi:hypothetical protein